MDYFNIPEPWELEEDRQIKLENMRKKHKKHYDEVEFTTLLEEEREKLINELVRN